MSEETDDLAEILAWFVDKWSGNIMRRKMADDLWRVVGAAKAHEMEKINAEQLMSRHASKFENIEYKKL